MTRFRKVLFPVGLVLGAILIAGWLRATKPVSPANPITERVWTVDVLPVAFSNVQPDMRLFAQIVAGREVRLRSLVSGVVETVGRNFSNGGVVEKGEMLITIDPFFIDRDLVEQRTLFREAGARFKELVAQIELEDLLLVEDHVQLKISQADFERYVELVGGAVSERKLDEVRLMVSQAQTQVLLREQNHSMLEAQIDQQRAVVERLTAAVESAERRRSDTVFHAPFGGYLTDISVNEGMWLNAGDSMGRLIEARHLEARVFLSDEQFARAFSTGPISRPATVRWEIGDSSVVFDAVVDRLESEINPALGGVHVFARLGPSATTAALRPGAFVEVTIPDRVYEKVARLPQEALHEGGRVYAVVDGRLEERLVDLVGRDGDWVLLKGLLAEGEDIVLTRFTEIGPGVPVTITR